MAPLFITFEGLDGSGKSTHLQRAAAWMSDRGLPARVTHEPGGTPVGDAIRAVFLDPRFQGTVDGTVEAMLVFASRRQHLLEVIEPALAAGEHVLCDRFTDSTVAYQGAGRGLDPAVVDALDRVATGGRRPDLTILFDLPAEEAHARGQSESRRRRPRGIDRLDAEDLEFYRRVRAAFLSIAGRDPGRVSVVDSNGDRDATWRQVEVVLRSRLPGIDA